MILLHRLAADNFKQLQNVELRLPDSGAVLIEGHNEAGKSSLFEAVYFALFGKPLLGERDFALTDLKRYGADNLEVALDFSIGGREFAIVRRIGKNHTAKLRAPVENGTETISSLSEIRKRLSEEMRLSSDALLNTCFVEQKRLERLEDMDKDKRRDAINELLNLKVLTDLESRFKITREAREELETQKRRVEVARLDAELPALEAAVLQAEYSLRVARRSEAAQRASELQQEIDDAIDAQQKIVAQRQNMARELEVSTRLAARLKAIDNELSFRLQAWQNAEQSREESARKFNELQQHASTLPARVEKLKEQKTLMQALIENETRGQETAAAHEFWARWKEAHARREIAHDQAQSSSHFVSSFPQWLNFTPIAVAALALAMGLVAWGMIAAAVLAVAAFVIAALIVARLEKNAASQVKHSNASAEQVALASLEGEIRALEAHRPAILQNKTDAEIEALLHEYSAHENSLHEIHQFLIAHDLPTPSGALQTQLALREHELQREQEAVSQLGNLRREIEAHHASLKKSRDEFLRAWQTIFESEAAPDSISEAAQRLQDSRASLADETSRCDEENLRERDSRLQEEYSTLDRQIAAWQHERKKQMALLEALQREAYPPSPPDPLSREAGEGETRLLPPLPASRERGSGGEGVGSPEQKTSRDWEEILSARREAVIHQRASRGHSAAALGIGEQVLALQDEQARLKTIEEEITVRRRAGEIVAKTRGGIVSRVMPLTIANVRRLLPLLTEGRYRDVRWEEETNVLAVYDWTARDFVRKRVFSGGARDQISLALRLAFALATLPGEHNIRPGFLFLDEPLSSFDRARTQALVELLTNGLIRRHFQQIFLVSHSQSFDPALFDYRLQMDAGRVALSTLPL